MRFFNGQIMAEYPDEAQPLRERVLIDSLKGPQRDPLRYFQEYFKGKGELTHPLLGELGELADEIESCWDKSKGMNLVAGYIRGVIVKRSQIFNQQPTVYEEVESSIPTL